MAEIDRISIEQRGISGLTLMERAGKKIADNLITEFSANQLRKTAIFCGKGNNGGDGFVIARYLYENNNDPIVGLIGDANDLRGEAKINYDFLNDLGVTVFICKDEDELDRFLHHTNKSLLWIDCLLGTGAKGAPRNLIKKAIDLINDNKDSKHVIAVDISSGVDSNTGAVEGSAVFADQVYSIGLPKVGHILPPGVDYCNNLRILDIGFPKDLLQSAESNGRFITASDVDQWIPKRKHSSYKGTEGHVLIVAGSKGMTGAALMCAQSALMMGAGLVTILCPHSLLPIYANNVWEALTLPVQETDEGSISLDAFETIISSNRKYDAIVIGPGLGLNPSTQSLVQRMVSEIEIPMLIDGDGLSAISTKNLEDRAGQWVVTPHPGEMARLYDTKISEVQSKRFDYVKRLSELGGVSILKGPYTIISSPEETFVNPTGTSAMASGGMGDVLAGMIGALMAKSIPTINAVSSGVYLHGFAAETIAADQKIECITATQLISNIQQALSRVREMARSELLDIQIN
jgi:hydroxyethylthiazole kinase-like uncharacterized protein yjeF